jgi:hypothetical protein
MTKQLFIASILLASTIVSAESLEEKTYWKGENDYINKSIDSANESCGTKFSFDWVDRPTFRTQAQKADNSPSSICLQIVDQVGGLCRDGDDQKAAVKAKIKGFRCGYSKPRSLDLAGGVIKYMGNNDEANFSDWAKPWLMKKL